MIAGARSSDPSSGPLRNSAQEAPATVGVIFATVAGSIDGYGLTRVGHYVSHMSGTTSLTAQALAQSNGHIIALTMSAAVAFVSGAGLKGALSDLGRSVTRVSAFRLLTVEALLIASALVWSLVAGSSATGTLGLMVLLPFAMGLQNALAARFVRHHPRTTHVTETLTSLGYHLGRLARGPVQNEDRTKVLRSALLFSGFLSGGVGTRLAYNWIGDGVLAAPAATAGALSLLTLSCKLGLAPTSTAE